MQILPFFREPKKLFLVVLGTLILAFGTAVFILPFDLVVGGISSIAILVAKVVPVKAISLELWITLITWGLFLLGAVTLGRDFAFKTLISALVYPVGIALFSKLLSPDVLGGVFLLRESEYAQIAILLAALFGGVLIGAGCALTFLGGGSTGGVDIIAFLLCRIFRRWRSSVVIFIIDGVTITLGLLILKDMVISLLGITSALISALAVDKIFLGQSRAFIAQIVSDRWEEINAMVTEKLERSTSIVPIRGGYTGAERKMLIVSFTMNQYSELLSFVNRVDKKAFITVHQAHEINGEGWTYDSPFPKEK